MVESACNVGYPVWSLDWEDSLEKGMATHSSTLAWRIPWTEEPGSLQSMGSHRVGHEWATSLSFFARRLKWWVQALQIIHINHAQRKKEQTIHLIANGKCVENNEITAAKSSALWCVWCNSQKSKPFPLGLSYKLQRCSLSQEQCLISLIRASSSITTSKNAQTVRRVCSAF